MPGSHSKIISPIFGLILPFRLQDDQIIVMALKIILWDIPAMCGVLRWI